MYIRNIHILNGKLAYLEKKIAFLFSAFQEYSFHFQDLYKCLQTLQLHDKKPVVSTWLRKNMFHTKFIKANENTVFKDYTDLPIVPKKVEMFLETKMAIGNSK